LFFNQKKLSG